LRFACGIWAAVAALMGVNLVMYNATYRPLIMMGAFCGALVDFTITASMCYFLAKHRDAALKRSVMSRFYHFVCMLSVRAAEPSESLINYSRGRSVSDIVV
jgi:hypothetical protein